MRASRLAAAVVAAAGLTLVAGIAGAPAIARWLIEREALTTGPNGRETPASLGVPFERRWIASGGRRLDSYLVAAPASCADPPALLIYPGVHETISKWVRAQQFLRDHCVSSLAFDFTGSGDSSRPASIASLDEDSLAAFEASRRFFPHARLFVLGHSMGAAPMLETIARFPARPAGVIVAGAFASLRDYGERAGGLYALLARLSPDWWDNARAIGAVRAPILVIGSDADKVIPVGDARRLFAAAHEPKRLVIVHGYRHNALYRAPTQGVWGPIVAFMAAPAAPAQRLRPSSAAMSLTMRPALR